MLNKRLIPIAMLTAALCGASLIVAPPGPHAQASPQAHHQGPTQTAATAKQALQPRLLKAKPQNRAPKGWGRLFDGETLVGWTPLSGKASYVVENGNIVGTTKKGSPNTFLTTLKTYSDFELQFEVKLDHKQLNSGCQIRSKIVNPKAPYGGRYGGPQVEIEDGRGVSGYIYGEASGGWQSKNPNGRKHKHYKTGQWNHYHIIAKGNHIQTFINGNKVEDFKLKDGYHKRFTKGSIGLQVHGVGGAGPFKVRWRNIYIKELSKK